MSQFPIEIGAERERCALLMNAFLPDLLFSAGLFILYHTFNFLGFCKALFQLYAATGLN